MTKDIDLPTYYMRQKGSLNVSKGMYNGIKVISWDAVKVCLGARCPCADLCEYKGYSNRGMKCRVQLSYVTEMFRQFVQQYPDIEEYRLTQFGTMLMPLYTTLSWLQIHEVSITQPVELLDNGARRANPIYREIRETIRLIAQTAKSLGFDGVPVGALDPAKMQKKVNEYGDPDALFDMEEEETETKGKFKVKK